MNRQVKMVKTWSIVLLACISLFSCTALAKYSGGTGTSTDPYRIATAEDLNDINNHSEDSNKCFLIVSDINLAAYDGNKFNIISGFSGVFDGNGHTISNFRFSSLSQINNVGLFANFSGSLTNLTVFEPNVLGSSYIGVVAGRLTNGGTIENCHVENCYVLGYQNVGGLVGYCDNKSIKNCSSSGRVRGTKNIGGIIGYNYGPLSSIEGCYFSGTISGDFEGTISNAGGIAGYNHYYARIEQCFCDANVYGSGDFLSGTSYKGGLVGRNENFAKVLSCFADSNLRGDIAGGLVGYNLSSAEIVDCYSTGYLKTDWGGGLVGINSAAVKNCFASFIIGFGEYGGLVGHTQNGSSITNCFWDINVTGVENMFKYINCSDVCPVVFSKGLTSEQMKQIWSYPAWACSSNWVIDEGNDYPRLAWQGAAGTPIDVEMFFDKGTGTPTDPYLLDKPGQIYALGLTPCLFNSHFTMIDDIDMNDGNFIDPESIGNFNSSFTGVFDGAGHFVINFKQGMNHTNYGLFGVVNGKNATIKDLGLVNPEVNSPNSFHVAALAESIFSGTITRCFVSGGSLRGKEYLGGLTSYVSGPNSLIENCYVNTNVSGENFVGGLADYVSNSGKVKNSYSASPVTASGTKGGLIAGNSSGIVENSFWDIDSSGQPTSAGGTGLSTEQMKTFLTYSNAGWDFNNVWHICEITNYPRLLWQVPLADMLCPYGVDFIDYSFLASRWLWSDRGDCGGLELTGDGIVNSAELAILANYWQQTACGDCAGIDYSGDGNVDSSDLVILCDNWLIADYGDIDGAELTGDGLVDLEDLYAFVENWLDGL